MPGRTTTFFQRSPGAHAAMLAVRARGSDPSGPSCSYAVLKTAIDAVLALILLIPGLPLMLACMAAVKLTSSGPALYSQVRVGLRGRTFRIFKIRSMWHDCERQSGPCWSNGRDPRVMPLGWFLRKTHLDELPQLWNVLRGEMSLIGPRPERPELMGPLERALPRYRERLDVKPGVTGLAQVQLPPDSDLESVRRKLAYDLFYVDRLSPLLDLRILLGTVLHVFGMPAATIRRAMVLPAWDEVEATAFSFDDEPATDDDAPAEALVQAQPA